MIARSCWGAFAAAALLACGESPEGRTYYARNIEPLLVQSCAGNTSGCHSSDGSPAQFAAGNFDVMSFENVQKRRDVLRPFGAYSYPLLLIKAVGPGVLPVSYGEETRTLQVQHAGGANLTIDSQAFYTLLEWLENGATENGLAPPTPAQPGEGACSTVVPPGFVPAPYLAHPAFAEFRDEVQPVLEGCNSASCHGAGQSDFYISCGDDDAQLAYNFSQAWAFVDNPADDSELLRMPLAVAAGGLAHTGGDQFDDTADSDYVAVRTWAAAVGALTFGEGDPGKEFFAENVQPVLLERGCSFQACHSPAAGNDFKLRAGSQGFFSAVALEKNYELMRDEFMAVEFPDARRGRAVAKNILGGFGGIAHRGGPVLETPGAGPSDPATCGPFDAATASAFCVVQEWVRIERQALLGRGEATAFAPGDLIPMVYVDRQTTHVATPQDFDRHQPGADLRVQDLQVGAGQALTPSGGSRSLLDSCRDSANQPLNLANVDVRAPDVRRDGTSVAFAMRTGAADPLGVWVVQIDGTGCQRLTPAVPAQGGIQIHNFDPAWSNDGASIAFASTRGRAGPSVSRKLFLPQADIWRMDGTGGNVTQMTVLSNSELGPQFMREGRLTMTTEKAFEGFYQLAGRRINWDLTDYHPLLAQRASSSFADGVSATAVATSVGYAQATDIREDANGDFAVILSDVGARGGAGTLATFNRSIGPFEAGRLDDGYLASMRIIDAAATGRVGASSTGAYRGTATLPDGQILTSYATGFQGDLATATQFDWDVIAVHPRTGARTILVGGAGAQVDAVLAYRRPFTPMYSNRRQLVFGGDVNPSDLSRAVVHMPDAPMVFTLFTSNLRRGRPLATTREATQLAIYAEDLPPAGTTSGNRPDGTYVSRRLLGTAPLAEDGSLRASLPAGMGLVFELQNGSGSVLNMGEEHQFGPGERISMGVREPLFDAVCGSCHGSITGSELDVVVQSDALTGASASASKDAAPVVVGP